MFQHILVPLDGSRCAEQALPMAARVARASRGTLTLLHVVNDAYNAPLYGLGASSLPPDLLARDLIGARKYLERVRLRDDLTGVSIETRAVLGNPATAILDDAEKQPTDLVILSSHGYSGVKRWLLGSIAERIARHASVPVLMLRGGEAWPYRQRTGKTRAVRALVPIEDVSTHALAALTPAAHLVAALSAPNQGEVHLAQIVAVPKDMPLIITRLLQQHMQHNLTTISQNLREEWRTDFSPTLRPALSWSASLNREVTENIVRVAEHGEENEISGEEIGYDFLALTMHGGSFQWWSMGSTVEHVLHTTRLPVLLVRPAKLPHQAPHQQTALAHSGSR